MINISYLLTFIAPHLKKMFIDIKNVEGDMVIIVYYENKETYRVSLNELNESLHRGVIIDDNKFISPDR